MEWLLLALGAAFLAWTLARLGFSFGVDPPFVALIRGFRALGSRDWPVGVQEEDRDQPWGKQRHSRRPVERELKPTVERVKPAVRVR